MKEEFLRKLNNREYISNCLFLNILQNNIECIPNDFDLDDYNNQIVEELYVKNKYYFDHLYDNIDSNIHLDYEQIKAILSDEQYALIIAGAGTGKTTTMVAKVKYLVEKKDIDPHKILVMSYTRKATEELIERINEEFNLQVDVSTYHSLGFKYIKDIYSNKKCDIIDRNKKQEIFLNYFKKIYKDKKVFKEIIENFEVIKNKYSFIFSKYFLNNYELYETYDDFLAAYVTHKMKEAKDLGIDKVLKSWINKRLVKDDNIKSIKGDLVKSAGEFIISNYLFTHNIDYIYEEKYDELMDNKSVYKPDFTIDYGGEKIYLEYFGLDNEEYNKVREKKEKYHKDYHNKFIELVRTPLYDIEKELEFKLKELGIIGSIKSSEEIYEHILKVNPTSQIYPFCDYLYECVRYIKSSPYRGDASLIVNYINSLEGLEKEQTKIQARYIADFYKFYSDECRTADTYYFDFEDLLYYSNKYIEKLSGDVQTYDYIIIDEYQDISNMKYKLLDNTAKRNNAKIYAVGDDWQSIYSFSGSNIEYIYNFNKYFKGAKQFRISKTYRNSQELINYSGSFIMKNENQIKKNLISDKHINNPIIWKSFNSVNDKDAELDCLKETIMEIHKNNPDYRILVITRYNSNIRYILDDNQFIDGIDTDVIYKDESSVNFDLMTMHKSKGLTFDEVILFGLNKSFPSQKYDIEWIEALYRNKEIDEGIPFAEERRIFYVALTRTKNHVYLLCDENYKNRSPFIDEIKNIVNGE